MGHSQCNQGSLVNKLVRQSLMSRWASILLARISGFSFKVSTFRMQDRKLRSSVWIILLSSPTLTSTRYRGLWIL